MLAIVELTPQLEMRMMASVHVPRTEVKAGHGSVTQDGMCNPSVATTSS